MTMTVTKKDTRREIASLNHRLRAYRIAYIQAAWDWLKVFIDNLNNITDDRYGWTRIHPAMEIEERLREQFADVWDIQRPYSPVSDELMQVWRNFFTKQIKPINEAIDEHVKAWWNYAWRTYRVNFRAVIPAPQPIPHTFKKIGTRTYQLGQITVKIDKEKQWREVQFETPSGIVLYISRCHGMNIDDCLSLALPIARRIAGLGDWAHYFLMPFAAQVAMKEKLRIVIAYYQGDYWEYRERRKQFHLWKPEEELQAILQGEKDRHAQRR